MANPQTPKTLQLDGPSVYWAASPSPRRRNINYNEDRLLKQIFTPKNQSFLGKLQNTWPVPKKTYKGTSTRGTYTSSLSSSEDDCPVSPTPQSRRRLILGSEESDQDCDLLRRALGCHRHNMGPIKEHSKPVHFHASIYCSSVLTDNSF